MRNTPILVLQKLISYVRSRKNILSEPIRENSKAKKAQETVQKIYWAVKI